MINPPTDNLYKFIAIFGLIITLFSVYYNENYVHELAHASINVNAEQESIKLEIEYFKNRYEQVMSYLEDVTDREKFLAVSDEINKARLEFQKGVIKAEANWKKMKLMDADWLLAERWAGIMGIVLGISLMGAGFLLWYARVQRPLDYQLYQQIVWAEEKQVNGDGKKEQVLGQEHKLDTSTIIQ
jgi:hypothetical protein